MYIFKNAIKNLGRNKGRNIILGIIMVCLLAVASVSLSIDSTTDKIKQSYKEMYGSEVFFQPDFEKLMANNNEGNTLQFPEITQEQYKKFMSSDYIKETKVLYSMGMQSSNTKHVEQEEEDSNANNGTSFSTTVGGLTGEQPNFSLLAYSDLKHLRDFTEGKRKFISGDMFKNDNEAIISEDYAKLNDLVIGSKIKLNQPDKITEIELTIVGIFQDNKKSQFGGMVLMPMLDPKNEIIVSENTLLGIKVEDEREYNANYTFYLKDPDMLEAFNKEAHDNGLSEFLNIATDEASYNQMVKPIEGIAQTSMMFLMVFLAFACGLLILLSILSVRERKYEVGVLRAIGMKKSQVMRTLLYESFVTMLVCLFLGLGIGALAAKPVSTTMLNNQKQNSDMGSMFVVSVGAEAKEIETRDVQLSMDAIMKVSVVGIIVALVSTSVGIVYVLRYEPMEILVERN